MQNHNCGDLFVLFLTLFLFFVFCLLLCLWGVVFVFVFALPADIAVNIFTLTKENALTLHCNIETNVTQEISLY